MFLKFITVESTHITIKRKRKLKLQGSYKKMGMTWFLSRPYPVIRQCSGLLPQDGCWQSDGVLPGLAVDIHQEATGEDDITTSRGDDVGTRLHGDIIDAGLERCLQLGRDTS